ncbi:MAG TPA: hypothetical protein VFV77_06000, partial [Gammaproteobacteria bacterium]|nr:hypothetical protein [Gammaproteobacteria bacterium]
MRKPCLLAAAACALLFAACGRSSQVDPVAYQKDIDSWRAGRVKNVAGPDGWSTLVGLYWFKEGANRFGSGADNDLVLASPRVPAEVGIFTLDAGKVSFTAAKGADVQSGGKPVTTLRL